MSNTTRLENQILHFSKAKKWDKIEALWPQLTETPFDEPEFYTQLGTAMVKDGKTDDLKVWIMLVVGACQEKGEYKTLLKVCRGILRAQSEFEDLRQPLLTTLRELYKKAPRLEEYIEASGLTRQEGLYKPLLRFLQYIKCSEGEVFQHAEWGEGVIRTLDLQEGRVTLDFTKGGEKSFSFGGVNDFLKKIPRNHLIAQRLLSPRKLAQRAEDEPVEFLKYCLKCLGGKTSRGELKEYLTQGIFDNRKWNNWWSRNRDAFRFDPYIGFRGNPSNAHLELRTEPKSFHEEMVQAFLEAEEFSRQYSLLTDLLKAHEAQPIPDSLALQMIAALELKVRSCKPDDITQQVEYLYLLQDLHATLKTASPLLEEMQPEKLIQPDDGAADLICALTVADHQLRAAQNLKQAEPDKWVELAESLFLSAPSRLSQWILRDMIDDGHLETASHMAEQLLHRPYENPELFLWLTRAVRDGKFAQLHVDAPEDMLFDAVIEFIEDTHKRIDHDDPDSSAFRTAINRFQNFLMDNHYELLMRVFETYEQSEARSRYQALMGSGALSDSFKMALDQVLRSVRRDLDETNDDSTTGQGEHLVTQKAFEQKQAEYMNIKNVEIPANSKAIGVAAAMGDLSENAEYESAKERQKVLFRRLEALEDLLQRARVMEPDHISTDSIGFGTAFQIKNMDTGEIEEYTLLGLWDAEPEKNILSYVTPFGRQFLKCKVGHSLVVVRPGGGSTQYKVLSIRNALLP
ncbi:MAG TPA: GreA/GreB family elongation factor [Candidatus Sumerlaeota bacterium]|nr:GreA/GreB family elongation factor [Candidatus Sumerlaeota bacterium]HPS00036.1 GreA/GreB family elongation factor [Candidatus Sumerlaeota bacterium]